MLLQLEGEDEGRGEEPPMDGAKEAKVLQQLKHEVVEHHLSYNAMHDTSSLAMIRMKTFINSFEVHTLIDGESFDNFIQPRTAKFLNLPVVPAPGFKVIVGNFNVIEVEGCIPSLEIFVQGYKIRIPKVYVLHVAGGELVIGTTWLKTWKAHIMDYDSSFLCYLHGGQFVAIHGEKPSTPSPT